MTRWTESEWAEAFEAPPPSPADDQAATDVLLLLDNAEARAAQVRPADRATVAQRLSGLLQRLRWAAP